MLSPLLGKYVTAEEFHQRMVGRVCAQCEEDKLKPPQSIKEYTWKKRKYLLSDLFNVGDLNLACEHEYLGRDADQSKLARAKKLAEAPFDN